MPAVTSLVKIFILGSGNVATHLSQAFARAGHQISGVYSRQLAHAAELAACLNQALATDELDFRVLPAADVYLLCLSDAAVAGFMKQARFPAEVVVAHTSGSLPLAVLADQQQIRPAVFYPIQTFSKHQPVDLASTPIAVEASDPEVAARMAALAASISQQVVALSSEERRHLHLAAVFACNFTNHLLGIGRELMARQQLDPTLLHPLIEATFRKALSQPPFQVQTGPAVRGDENILARQQELLEDAPLYREIYALLSESIRQKKPL